MERAGLDLLTVIVSHCTFDRLALPAQDRRMRAALRHIEAHLDRPISVRELADLAGVSPSRLHQIVRQGTGRTPLAAIDAARFRLAGLPPAAWRAMTGRRRGGMPVNPER